MKTPSKIAVNPHTVEGLLLISEPLAAGAAAVYAQNLMAGLTQANIAHPLLTPAPLGIGLLSKQEAARVQVANGLSWLNWRPFVFKHVIEWIKDQNPALLHGISEHAATLCLKLSETLRLPYVLTVHSFMDRERLHISKLCQTVIAVSEPLREHLVNDHRISKDRVRVIPQGVPHNMPSRATDSLPAAKLVVSSGDFSSKSDFATFLEAARRIADKQGPPTADGSGCSFIVSGEGSKEATLRAFTRELKLDKLLTFCHGHTEIERLFSEASVYVQTARREGFAIRALQAMACGVPVVAATNGAVLEVLDDGITGFIVPAGSHEAIYEKVLKLLDDPELRKKMGEAGRKAAQERFGVEQMLDETLAVYRDAVELFEAH